MSNKKGNETMISGSSVNERLKMWGGGKTAPEPKKFPSVPKPAVAIVSSTNSNVVSSNDKESNNLPSHKRWGTPKTAVSGKVTAPLFSLDFANSDNKNEDFNNNHGISKLNEDHDDHPPPPLKEVYHEVICGDDAASKAESDVSSILTTDSAHSAKNNHDNDNNNNNHHHRHYPNPISSTNAPPSQVVDTTLMDKNHSITPASKVYIPRKMKRFRKSMEMLKRESEAQSNDGENDNFNKELAESENFTNQHQVKQHRQQQPSNETSQKQSLHGDKQRPPPPPPPPRSNSVKDRMKMWGKPSTPNKPTPKSINNDAKKNQQPPAVHPMNKQEIVSELPAKKWEKSSNVNKSLTRNTVSRKLNLEDTTTTKEEEEEPPSNNEETYDKYNNDNKDSQSNTETKIPTKKSQVTTAPGDESSPSLIVPATSISELESSIKPKGPPPVPDVAVGSVKNRLKTWGAKTNTTPSFQKPRSSFVSPVEPKKQEEEQQDEAVREPAPAPAPITIPDTTSELCQPDPPKATTNTEPPRSDTEASASQTKSNKPMVSDPSIKSGSVKDRLKLWGKVATAVQTKEYKSFSVDVCKTIAETPTAKSEPVVAKSSLSPPPLAAQRIEEETAPAPATANPKPKVTDFASQKMPAKPRDNNDRETKLDRESKPTTVANTDLKPEVMEPDAPKPGSVKDRLKLWGKVTTVPVSLDKRFGAQALGTPTTPAARNEVVVGKSTVVEPPPKSFGNDSNVFPDTAAELENLPREAANANANVNTKPPKAPPQSTSYKPPRIQKRASWIKNQIDNKDNSINKNKNNTQDTGYESSSSHGRNNNDPNSESMSSLSASLTSPQPKIARRKTWMAQEKNQQHQKHGAPSAPPKILILHSPIG